MSFINTLVNGAITAGQGGRSHPLAWLFCPFALVIYSSGSSQ